MSHTPGPWTYDDESVTGSVWSGNAPSGAWPTGVCVASVLGDSAESEANARLIAAAPELLEALEECLEWIRQNGRPPTSELRQRVENAIAKARGGE